MKIVDARAHLATIAAVLLAVSAATAGAPAAEPVRNIVLVHGAFADGSSWNKVIPLLQAQGLNVVAVQNPLTSLEDDVAAPTASSTPRPVRSCWSAIPGAARSSPRPAATTR